MNEVALENGEDGLPILPYAVYNINEGMTENLLDCISALREERICAGVLVEGYDFEAHKQLVGMQPGDVPVTYADSTALARGLGFTPKMGSYEGMRAFTEWHRAFYQSKSSIQNPIRNEN